MIRSNSWFKGYVLNVTDVIEKELNYCINSNDSIKQIFDSNNANLFFKHFNNVLTYIDYYKDYSLGIYTSFFRCFILHHIIHSYTDYPKYSIILKNNISSANVLKNCRDKSFPDELFVTCSEAKPIVNISGE